MATPQQGNPSHKNPIPLAIRKQAEEAERLQRQLRGEEEPPKEGDNPPQPEPPKQEAQPEPAPQPQPEPAPQPEPKPQEPDWKQRFETEQGRNRKLREELNGLADEVSNLRRVLASVQNAPPPAPTPQGNTDTDISIENLLSDDERKEWGEVLPVIEKVARGLVAPLQKQLQTRIQEVDSKVTSVREHNTLTEKQRMLQMLDDPNNPINKSGQKWGPDEGSTWRDINRDEEFVAWLAYIDPLSGQKRHDMLVEAFNANDASRVGAFFANFLREVAAVAPPPAPASNPQPNGSAAPSLEQFAAPGRARTSAAPAPGPADAEVITSGDISHFFTLKTARRWTGPEADAFEAKIFKAENKGMIRPGPAQHPELVNRR